MGPASVMLPAVNTPVHIVDSRTAIAETSPPGLQTADLTALTTPGLLDRMLH